MVRKIDLTAKTPTKCLNRTRQCLVHTDPIFRLSWSLPGADGGAVETKAVSGMVPGWELLLKWGTVCLTLESRHAWKASITLYRINACKPPSHCLFSKLTCCHQINSGFLILSTCTFLCILTSAPLPQSTVQYGSSPYHTFKNFCMSALFAALAFCIFKKGGPAGLHPSSLCRVGEGGKGKVTLPLLSLLLESRLKRPANQRRRGLWGEKSRGERGEGVPRGERGGDMRWERLLPSVSLQNSWCSPENPFCLPARKDRWGWVWFEQQEHSQHPNLW